MIRHSLDYFPGTKESHKIIYVTVQTSALPFRSAMYLQCFISRDYLEDFPKRMKMADIISTWNGKKGENSYVTLKATIVVNICSIF